MSIIPRLLDNYVPYGQPIGSPLDGQAHDSPVVNRLHCLSLLDSSIRLSEESRIAYYEVVNGQGCRSSVTKSSSRDCLLTLSVIRSLQ